MNTKQSRQKWFAVMNPDTLLSRRDAINLIHRHADKVRAPEDLSDEQIQAELPGAWRRERTQQDLFHDAPLEASIEKQSIWRRFLCDS